MNTLSDLPPTPPSGQNRFNTSGLWSALKFVGSVLGLVIIINGFGLQSYEVFGSSMEPTLEPGDRLVISKLGKTYSSVRGNTFTPERGDIVVFDDPRGSSDIQLIKRVIALPGERVVLEDGRLMVFNDEHPEGINIDQELGLELDYTTGFVNLTVEEDHIFVSGDNRQPGGSLDSRNQLGTVPTDRIVGTLALRLFPLTRARVF